MDGAKRKLTEEVRTLRSQLERLKPSKAEHKQAEEALRESEQRYRAIFEQAADSIVLIDAETGELVEFNNKAHENLGYSREEFQKLKIPDFEIIESTDEVVKHIEKIVREGADTFETKHRTKDGQTRDIMVSSKAISIGGKNFCQSIWRDITERKKTEEALKDSERKLRLLFEGTYDLISLSDANAKSLWANPAWRNIFGHESEYETDPFGCIHPDDLEKVAKSWQNLISKGAVIKNLDYRYRTPKGEYLHLESSAYPVVIADEQLYYVVARDITECKKAEDNLKRNKIILENSSDLAFICDTKGNVTFLNRIFEELSGHKPEEFIGKSFEPLLDKENLEKANDLYSRTLSGKSLIGELCFKDTGKLCEYHTFPLKDEKGRIIGIIGVGRDITERKQAEEALRESENKYRMLFENTSMPVSFWSVNDWRILSMNAEGARKIGITPEEAIGKTTDEVFYDPDAAEKAREIFKKVLESGKGYQSEDCVEMLKGVKIWFRSDIQPVTDETGQVTAIQTISEDITDRKKAEEAVQESEQRFRTLFESAPDGIFLNDLEGRFVDGNDKAEQLTGYNKEELIGKTIAEANLLSDEQLPMAIANLKKTADGQPTGPDEFTLRNKDGSPVIVEIRSFPVEIAGQTLSLGIARDITERRKAQDELRQFKTISDGAGYGAAIIDVEASLIYVNESFAKMHGYRPEELIGKHVSIFHTKEQMPNVERLIKQLMREGNYVDAEVWHKRKDGTVFLSSMTGTCIMDEKGKPL
ncbi:MAG: PAS domain S-box protein [Planctomycetota bacterium]|jgi:PAS domain S-box-containing protein